MIIAILVIILDNWPTINLKEKRIANVSRYLTLSSNRNATIKKRESETSLHNSQNPQIISRETIIFYGKVCLFEGT